MKLPSPSQKWIHGCTSMEMLNNALKDSSITAIEADILMGFHLTKSKQDDGQELPTTGERRPILAHPPDEQSDLLLDDFLEVTLNEGSKHIKLDFKSTEVVRVCLPVVASHLSKANANGQALFLNADILPGPGFSMNDEATVNAEEFLNLWRKHCDDALLSLSWRLKLPTRISYSKANIEAMIDLLKDHSIRGEKVVFAANARCADIDVSSLKVLLDGVPGSQVLFWTATGEPALSNRVKRRLEKAFEDDCVGFDVNLALNDFEGFINDVGMWVYALYLSLTNK